MEWLQVSIAATSYGQELVRIALNEHGVYQTEGVLNLEEIRAVLAATVGTWDYACAEELQPAATSGLRFYLPASEEGRRQLAGIEAVVGKMAQEKRADADLGSLEFTTEVLRDEDWTDIWRQYFRPFPVGKRLLIKPHGQALGAPTERRVLDLQIASSFGTGDHATTRLCLEALDEKMPEGAEVLDIGCGSGILFVAALLLGARYAAGVDSDPHAVADAKLNAQLNGFNEERYCVQTCDALTPAGRMVLRDLCQRRGQRFDRGQGFDRNQKFDLSQTFDLVVANIVADVIIDLAATVRDCLRPGGLFIASGIIESKRTAVETALTAAGWDIESVRTSSGWAAILATA